MSGLEDVPKLTDTREFSGAVAACGGNYWLTHSAATRALINWLLRGQRTEIKRHAEQAAIANKELMTKVTSNSMMVNPLSPSTMGSLEE